MTDWAKLAEPFPADEIKQRPGAATWDHKPNCEKQRCRETRDPSKHIQFDYIDARAVAQRLDDVLTPAGWQFTCSAGAGDVVHGRLSILTESGDWATREDHGYPNGTDDAEPIKAATSDALKRCAVLFGIGRHLYEDNKAGRAGNGTPRPVAAPVAQRPTPTVAAAPARSTTDVPEVEFPPNEWEQPTQIRRADPRDGGACPNHGTSWTLKPGGVSKRTNKPYDPFWACAEKNDDGSFCNEKPSRSWQNQQAAS